MILNEWLLLFIECFEYPQKWCTYTSYSTHMKLMLSLCILCTPYTVSLSHHFMQSHILGACVFSCNLPPTLLTEWPESFMCYCSNTGEERIPKWVSTESWPWRTKFSNCFCQDLNLQPFDPESGALTTEVSLLPNHSQTLSCNYQGQCIIVILIVAVTSVTWSHLWHGFTSRPHFTWSTRCIKTYSIM